MDHSSNLEVLFGRTNLVGLLKTRTATTPWDQNQVASMVSVWLLNVSIA